MLIGIIQHLLENAPIPAIAKKLIKGYLNSVPREKMLAMSDDFEGLLDAIADRDMEWIEAFTAKYHIDVGTPAHIIIYRATSDNGQKIPSE
jgi:hypothetical protein